MRSLKPVYIMKLKKKIYIEVKVIISHCGMSEIVSRAAFTVQVLWGPKNA